MSRQPEHLSLDEVKKLLKSLEDVSAADDSEPSPPSFPTVQAAQKTPLGNIEPDAPTHAPPITLTAAPLAPTARIPEATAPLQKSPSLAQKVFFPALGLTLALAGSVLFWRPVAPSIGGAASKDSITTAGKAAPSTSSDDADAKTSAAAAAVVTAKVPATQNDSPSPGLVMNQAELRAASGAPISTAAIASTAAAPTEAVPEVAPAPAAPQALSAGPSDAKLVQATPQQRKAPPDAGPPAVQPSTQSPRATTPAPQASPPMSDSNRADDIDVTRLIADGKAQISTGLVASARLLFRRAADAGSPEAARLLGDTFDPAKLFTYGVRGIEGDIEKAIYWYERADELGDPHAKARLLSLGAR